jgi:endo-alpha-1,4-polygalactosaminidase (GH114 family)
VRDSSGSGREAKRSSTPAEVTAELEEHLDIFLAAGKLVLVVDYASSQEMVRDAYTRSRARGYVSTVTVVDLDRLPFELW